MLLTEEIAECERLWRSDGSDPRMLRRLIELRRRSGLPIPAELVDALVRPAVDRELAADFEIAVEETLTPCAIWQGSGPLHWQRRSRIRSFEHRALWLRLDPSLDSQPSPAEVLALLRTGLVNAISLNLEQADAEDVELWLRVIQQASALQRLELSYLPRQACADLRRFHSLTHLRIEETEDSLDEVLGLLQSFPELVTLRIGGVVAASALEFQQFEPLLALTRLAISCYHGSRAQPIRRARLPELRDLVLEGFQLNRGDARAIAAISQLRDLEFAGSVEDIEDSLVELSQLKSLQRLNLTSPALGPELTSEGRGRDRVIQLATFSSMRAAAYRGLRRFSIESFATEALDQRAAHELPGLEGLARLELRGVMHETIGPELSLCRALRRLDLVDVYSDELVFHGLSELRELRELVVTDSELRGDAYSLIFRASRPELVILEAGRAGEIPGLAQLNPERLTDLRLRRIRESVLIELIRALPRFTKLKRLEISLTEALRDSLAEDLLRALQGLEALEACQLPKVKGSSELWSALERRRATDLDPVVEAT